MEGAGWLTAVADARQQAAEWEAEIGEALAEAGTEDMFALCSPANAMAFARGPEVPLDTQMDFDQPPLEPAPAAPRRGR